MWFDPREIAKTNDDPAATFATSATFQPEEYVQPAKVAEIAEVATPPEVKNEADADDRRHCAMCRNLDGTRCLARNLLVMDDLPRRCFDYLPAPEDDDQRSGHDRWPELLNPLEDTP